MFIRSYHNPDLPEGYQNWQLLKKTRQFMINDILYMWTENYLYIYITY